MSGVKEGDVDMHADNAYNAGMIQYTLRGIPPYLDSIVRREAARRKMSLNSFLVEILKMNLAGEASQVEYNDMDDLVGTWAADPEFDSVQEDFSRIDGDLWA